MGYMRPQNFETEYPTHEFLRKPIKHTALISCLREIWGKFDVKSRSLATPRSLSSVKRPFANQVFKLNILIVEGRI